MGATHTRRSRETLGFPAFEPIFSEISMLCVLRDFCGFQLIFHLQRCHIGAKNGVLQEITMATRRARKQADGTMRYSAIVRLRKGKQLIHRETKTFSQRSAAEKWAKSRLEDPVALTKAQQGERSLSSLIRWYIDNFSSVSKWQRTKQAQLEFLEKHPTAKANIFNITSGTLIDHVRSRRATGAGPATASNDLTWIGVVFRAARSVEAIPINPTIRGGSTHRVSRATPDRQEQAPRSPQDGGRPRPLLSAQTKRTTWEEFGWRAPARLLEAQPEIFRRHSLKRNVGLAKLG